MRKQLLKNLCAAFLAGFMALLLLPQSAQAQEKEAYVVKSSDKPQFGISSTSFSSKKFQ